MPLTTTLSSSELEALMARALECSRTSPGAALSVARALTRAEIDGHKGHGLSRLATYAAQARAGKVDGFAVPKARQTRPASAMIDVGHGFAYPALDLAIEMLPAMARKSGVAACGFIRSHHFGVAGHAVERLADEGLVALIFGNTPQAMASWGGRRAVFGTNPIAFAAPRRNGPPVVVDLAMSQVARGKILAAARKGDAIPIGWAVDAGGQPTTDASAALAGTLVPLGGAKGSALAFMVEVLAVALTGANFAFEASSFLDDQGPPPGVGQFLLGIDPAAFTGTESFLDRMGALADAIEGDEGARLPGTRRLALRERAATDGIAVETKLLDDARRLAGDPT